MTPPQPGEIQIEDQLERRIRKPVDLLRCILSCIEIVALALAGIAASATTAAVQADIVGASRQIPLALLTLARSLALIALFILPVALAVQLLARRQWRRLAEAVATGVLAAGVTAVANELLSREPASQLYDAIIMSHPGTSHIPALDPAVAGLVAYATMVGLVGRPAWRNALWVAVGVYSVVHVVLLHTPMLTLLITVIAGRAIGLAVRYVAGSTSQRPSARDIAAALTATNLPVSAIRRVRHEGNGVAGSRHYAVTDRDGTRLDIVVFDRDQQAAGAVYRMYRSVRLLAQVSRNAPLSVDRVVERRALLSYAAEDAGVPTPRLRALVRVGPEAAVLAFEHHDGTTLAQRNPGCSDDELGQIWDAVDRLHAQQVDPPRADRGPYPAHRRRAGHAARPGRRRRGRQRPADPPRRGPAPRRTLPLRRPGPVGRPRPGESGRGRAAGRGAAAAAGRAWPAPRAKRCAATGTCCRPCAPSCSPPRRASRSPLSGSSASGCAPC